MSELCWIPKAIYLTMCAFGKQLYPLETGGVFLGYVADKGDVVVTAIIGPGPNAKHHRYKFSPDAEYQQAKLSAHYLNTNGQDIYLGDWHTHPLGSASLSPLDKRTLNRIACTQASGISKPIMAILSGGSEEWDLGVVRFQGCKRRFLFNHYALTTLLLRIY